MARSLALEETIANAPRPTLLAVSSLRVSALANEHEAEVLAFLAARPIHTVIIAGFIRDNGLMDPLNRGTFYACRDGEGRLEGVAVIGHHTLMEVRSET